jgi:hypothetical protein
VGGAMAGAAMAGAFLGMLPLQTIDLLQYSQHWRASDVFRAAPMLGPAALFDGARWAVLVLLTLPLAILLGILVSVIPHGDPLLLIPGMLGVPIYALYPGLGGHAVPLSLPTEDAKGTKRALSYILMMILSAGVGGIGAWARYAGWFWRFVAAEGIGVTLVYAYMRASIDAVRWSWED